MWRVCKEDLCVDLHASIMHWCGPKEFGVVLAVKKSAKSAIYLTPMKYI